MCNRYVRRSEIAVFAKRFDFLVETPTPPAFNIAPTDLADIVRVEDSRRRHVPMAWGFLAASAKDTKKRVTNARGETVHESRLFRTAFEQRRCLILADGIIEWQTAGTKKIPHLFTLQGDQPFAFAGIWNRSRINDAWLETCAIITTEANELFARIHDRMPVVLQDKAIAPWLDPDAEPDAVREFLTPYPANEMVDVTINPKVNNSRYKSPDGLEPTPAVVSRDLFSD